MTPVFASELADKWGPFVALMAIMVGLIWKISTLKASNDATLAVIRERIEAVHENTKDIPVRQALTEAKLVHVDERVSHIEDRLVRVERKLDEDLSRRGN